MTGWWLLAGCPWISPDEHFAQDKGGVYEPPPKDGSPTEQAFDEPPGGETDTDETTRPPPPPAGGTTETDPSCVDDPTLVPLGPPTETWSAVCPGSQERFWVDVDPYESLVIQLLDIDCGDPGLVVDLLSPQGDLQGRLDSFWVCVELELTTEHQQYEVVVRSTSSVEIPYGLSVGLANCGDSDGDGHTNPACGGDDCDDEDASVYPGAVDIGGNDIDEDCDGGDELPTCTVQPFQTSLDGIDTLRCADLSTGAAWDRWVLPDVVAGSELYVALLNNGNGDADLLAFVVGSDGTSHYGLEPDGSQLDDDTDCGADPWTGGSCPLQCLQIEDSGDVEIWVAQKPGTGCVDGAEYAIIVYDDIGPGDLTFEDDDVPFGWP